MRKQFTLGPAVARVTFVAALTVAAAALPLGAQIRMSERGSVSQVLDGTTISVEYYRPVARGRDSLFGKQVKWGEVWTPGANWATTIEADRDIRLNGQPLPKGKYTIWMVPRQTGEWSVLLNRESRRFHVPQPDTTGMALRFTVMPEQRPAEEVLTWSFPSVGPDAATLRMQWGTTAIPIRVSTEPTRLAVVPAGKRATYVGTYSFTRPNGAPGTASVVDEAGTLRVHQEQKVYGIYDYFDFVPDGPNRFKRALYRDGKLAEVESELTYVFQVAGGRATGYDLLDANGAPLFHATRVTTSSASSVKP